MIAIIVCLVLIFLAAAFNAVMDACENTPNFDESIFSSRNRKFWLKEVSWEYAKKLFSYKFDAWHIAKTCMVICFSGALVAAYHIGVLFPAGIGIIYIACTICVAGVIWIASFTLFYHIIFKVK